MDQTVWIHSSSSRCSWADVLQYHALFVGKQAEWSVMAFYVFKTQLAFVSVVIQNVIRPPSFHQLNFQNKFEWKHWRGGSFYKTETGRQAVQCWRITNVPNLPRASSSKWQNVPVDHPPAVFVVLLKFLLDEFLVLCWLSYFWTACLRSVFVQLRGFAAPLWLKAGYCTPRPSIKEASLQLEDWTASKPKILREKKKKIQ